MTNPNIYRPDRETSKLVLVASVLVLLASLGMMIYSAYTLAAQSMPQRYAVIMFIVFALVGYSAACKADSNT